MLSATFLGWQGWLIESAGRRLLFDPLLVEEAGRGPAGARLDCIVYPPRRWTLEALPPVDAVFLSHEHEDHFNIPTLVRLDRRIPIYLSDRSSTAAWTLCRELGFAVQALSPGGTVAIGDLEVTAFAQDPAAPSETDEWDTLGYLVRHTGGAGSFFTNVDIAVTTEMVAAVPPMATLTYQGMTLRLGPPTLESGSGLAPVPHADAGQARSRLVDGDVIAPLAGERFTLRGGLLVEVVPRSPFLETPPREQWPARVPIWRSEGEALRPACGRGAFEARDLGELEAGLARFAEFLYGRRVFRFLNALDARQLGGRTPTLAWVLLREGEPALVVEYSPRDCAFRRPAGVPDPAPLPGRHAGVVTSYASDLLALLRGDFEPRVITRSLAECWAVPGATLLGELWLFFHPLRHPTACLARYRAFAAELADVRPVVRAPG